MNYVELRAAIQNYSVNTEESFVASVDTFIHLAEARIRLMVRLPKFRKEVSGWLRAGRQLVRVPPDFLAPDSLEVMDVDGSLHYPLNKDPEFIDECYPSAHARGMPRFYAFLNERFLKLGPRPNRRYAAHLSYFYQPASITETKTSWIGEHFAHALLSGALVEAAKYMKAEDSLYQRLDQAFGSDLQMDLAYAKGRAKKDTYETPDTRVEV